MRDGKNSFYKKLNLDKKTLKIIKAFKEFKKEYLKHAGENH